MSGRTTIAQIARSADVSVSTVSKVLNGHTDVAEETRRRVQRLLDERGYRRRRAAHHRGHGDLIDLVINNLDSAWGLAILTGVEEVVESAGIGLVISAVHSRAALTRRWLDSLLARGSQGAILVLSDLDPAQREQLRRHGTPIVVIDGVSQPPPDVPAVGATNFAGGYAAAEHLIGLGHRRIGVIGGPEQLACTRARIAGYRAAHEAGGVPIPRGLLRYGNFYHDGGLRAARSLLELPDAPTAIFAGSDMHAMGVYEAARQSGLDVPGDLSVVGFDDLNFASWTAPALTTVRQPLHEMGATAARTLLRLIGGEALDSSSIELATSLVVRDSTAPPRTLER
ncbi:LacI family DNA-binding transcriptional regulator [Cryptosporangium aurantiacum]|uniref:Transcriptional regulator, LacI family n=1 Tax=Cryptosporangium aurantiacum TaxID=134849 RepID=A0A1M7HNR0_9ACTN|nr:LacI family DNA-binding transcriptional regulator [Cryptosporangium aurantiacum]SHM30060.1 transcriptional regulator, LacI family [Cryptosporangium aurantiacum]